MTYLILGAISALAVFIASAVIAWAIKHTPVDRYEDGLQSEADIDVIKRASESMPLEQRRRVRAGDGA